MGRELFSKTRYRTSVLVKESTPDLSCDDHPRKWSFDNRFDPDADEFFERAQYEAFLDQGEVDLEERPVTTFEVTPSSPEFSPISDAESAPSSPRLTSLLTDPMRMSGLWTSPVPTEPASNMPGYSLVDPPLASTDNSEMVNIHVMDDTPRPVLISNHSPVPITRALVGVTELPWDQEEPMLSPLTIGVETATHSVVYPESPSTPLPLTYTSSSQLMTPSPPVNSTPRVYMWGSGLVAHPPVTAGSPTLRMTHAPAGPFTNPDARQSLARLPVRV